MTLTFEVVSASSKFRIFKDDPKDNMAIETAHDGRADFIVSGDWYLLALKNFDGIKVVDVKQMLMLLEEKPT